MLRVNLPAQDLGEQELRLPQIAPNQFAAVGTELAVAGDWQVTAILREIGAFSWTAQSALRVGTSPPEPAVVNPPPRFGGLGIVGMLLLAAGCLALAFGAVACRRARRPLALLGEVALSVAGAALLLVGRLPVASAPELADVPVVTVPVVAGTPAATMEDMHGHEMNMAQAATPEAAGAARHRHSSQRG